jgi:two-component system CheB/CheR fusion protein
MKNLLNSIEVATLFLDKKLNIRRYTDQVTQIFKLKTVDIGRPFTDLVSDLRYPEIATDANQVIKSLIYIEKATVTTDGRWYNVRIMPYRTVDDRIDGLVITFTDITAFKNLESKLKLSEERFRISLENTPISVFNQDNELRYTWIHNPFINRSIEDIIGKKDEDFLTNECVTQLNEIKTEVLKSGISQNKEIQLVVHGVKNTFKLMISPLKNNEGTIIGITGITWDVNKLGS